MHKVSAMITGHARTLQALTAAAALLAIGACATAPSQQTQSDPASDSAPPAGPAEPPQTSNPTPAPTIEETAAATPQPPVPPPGDEPDTATTAATVGPEPEPEPEPEREPADVAPAAAAGPPPADVALVGRVVLDVSQVEDVDDDSVRDTVLYFRAAGASMNAEPGNFEITTRRKRLMPDVLVIPVGSTVAFPNEDDILHNVFSVSSAANFDLGLYGEGQSKSHTFLEPGLAVIHCNVHHAMRADVLVVDTPFFARADVDGEFSIGGVEPGSGELVAWHPRAGFVRRQITLPMEESLELELTLVRPRIPDHLDKTGKPYRPQRPSGR